MSEREELAEALKALENRVNHTDTEWSTLKDRVFDAARKHLETLPKPMWRVTGLRPSNGGQGVIVQTTKERALDSARVWLDQDYSFVTVEQVAP